MSGILDLEARRQHEAAELEAVLAPLRVREAQVWAEVYMQLREARITQAYFLVGSTRYTVTREHRPRSIVRAGWGLPTASVRGEGPLTTAAALSESIRLGEALINGTAAAWEPVAWDLTTMRGVQTTWRRLLAQAGRWWTRMGTRLTNFWKVLRG